MSHKAAGRRVRVTIEEVAAAAGVSIKTVSRVLNRESNVRPETRQRVEDAASRLQYRPSHSARSLAGPRSFMVTFAYDNPSQNYVMEIQAGVLEACRAQHYHLVLAPLTYAAPRAITDTDELLSHYGSDGFVLIPPLADDAGFLAHLRERGIPFACVSPRCVEGRIGVTVDDRAAVGELVAHLLALGHRDIAHISGHPDHGASPWRLQGYREALQQAGIAVRQDYIVQGEFTFESGIEGARRLLDLPRRPSAIFAANDDMAAGVLRVAAERGFAVPFDLSVCGFDDTPLSRHVSPPLTTVRQPTRDMGRIAALELFREIRQRGAGTMIAMPYELCLRASTGLAPRSWA
jgi:LacI family transcriptional regulator